MAEAAVDEVLAEIRGGGGRVTTARRALVSALVEAGPNGHLTADDIVTKVRTTQPEVAGSTVYRLLIDLEERGLVRHVHTGHGGAFFHLISDTHHIHLICDSCDRIIDVPAKVLGSLDHRLDHTHGFRLNAEHTALHGICAECRGHVTTLTTR